MRRWTTAAVLFAVMLWTGMAEAQTALIGGGLTALPAVKLGPDKVQNGGFEALSGGVPAGWSMGSGWGVDQQVLHGGNFSYRRTTGAGHATQTIQLKQGIYKFSAWVKTENLGSGSTSGVRLQVDFRPGVNEWKTTDVISGTRDWTLYEIKNVIVPKDRTAVLKLENYGGPSGTAWFDDVKLEEQLPQPVEAFMLYPNYRGMLFDDQPQTMRFDVTVTPPGGDFGRYKVRAAVKDEGSGQVVASRDYAAAAHLVAELDGSLMQAGRPYLATLSLIDQSSGGAVSTYPAYRVSKVPGTARQSMNISFDAKNRVLVKGQPRFVLGVYDSGGGYSTLDSYWENALWSATGSRRMDGLRINFYLNYWMGEAPADAMKALMGNLQKRGVMYLQTGNCFDKFPAGSNFKINSSYAYVQDIGAPAGSAGYYTIDECRSELVPGAFSQYVRLRQLDPDSATFAALFGNSDIALWRDAADLLSSDPYPMFAAEPSGGYNHKQVADWTAQTRNAVKDARPFLTVLQFFKFTSQGRWPTRQEMRNHAYVAIVEGAKGLWWWSIGNGNGALATVCSDWCAERTSHMNDLKAVVGELADLEPVLLADDARGALTGNSNASAIRTKVKVVNGKGYVFAYNYTNQNVSATLTWNTAPGKVTVHAENRTLAPSGNAFADSFAPYQAHVYVLDNGGSGGSGDGGTTPPPPDGGSLTVGFTNPNDGASVSGTTTVTMSASGGSGYTYELAVDGSKVYVGTNNSFSWNTTTVANANHTLTATATDSGGKSGGASIKVNVSNTTSPPPAGSLKALFTSPAEGATVSGTQVAVNLWVEGQSGSSNTFSLSVDGQSLGNQTTSGTHVTYVWDSTKVADGSHKLTATVSDAGGNTGTSSRTVTSKNGVSGTPLTASIAAPAAGASVSATTTVSMAVSGAAAGSNTFTLSVDGTAVSTQTVSGTSASYAWDTTKVANGTRTLSLTAKDSTGKTATTSRSVNVSNSTSTPGLKVIITSPKAGAIVGGNTTVNVWVEGVSGSSNAFTLYVDNRAIGSSTESDTHAWFTWSTRSYTNGSHTVKATAKDAAGKTGTATITVTVRN